MMDSSKHETKEGKNLMLTINQVTHKELGIFALTELDKTQFVVSLTTKEATSPTLFHVTGFTDAKPSDLPTIRKQLDIFFQQAVESFTKRSLILAFKNGSGLDLKDECLLTEFWLASERNQFRVFDVSIIKKWGYEPANDHIIGESHSYMDILTAETFLSVLLGL